MICVLPRDQQTILQSGPCRQKPVQTLCDDFNQQNAELCANLLQCGCQVAANVDSRFGLGKLRAVWLESISAPIVKMFQGPVGATWCTNRRRPPAQTTSWNECLGTQLAGGEHAVNTWTVQQYFLNIVRSFPIKDQISICIPTFNKLANPILNHAHPSPDARFM